MYRDCFDVRVASKVVHACQQPYRVLRLGEEFLSDFARFAEQTIYITDGSLDVCGSHEVYLSRLAREIAPIRMTGNYGGEVLRSVSNFKAFPPNERLFHPDFRKFVQESGRTFADISGGHKLSFAVFKLMPWFLYGRLASAQSQLTLRTPYMDNDLVGFVYKTPADFRASKEIALRIIEDSSPSLYEIKTDMGFGGASNFLFSKCLQVFYWFLFKGEWYYNEGMPHWLAMLDYTLRPLHLERLILGRHKIEHYRKWFRDKLSDYVREILLDKQSLHRPYLNGKYLEDMVHSHLRGDRNYLNEINKTITVELIQRLLIEQR
jgi:asparagine synthase (glutamine-hydrolysing)